MLRDVTNKHVKPRIVPFRGLLSSTAASNVLNTGYGDYTWSRAGTGSGSVTHRQPFSRNGIAIGTVDISVAAGGYFAYNSTTSSGSAAAFLAKNTSGTNTDSLVEGFTFGWDNSGTDLTKTQRVACTLNYPVILWGRITGAGTVAVGTKNFSASSSASGVYTVNFTRNFSQVPIVVVQAVTASASFNAIINQTFATRTGLSVGVTTSDAAGTPTNCDFYIMVIGQQTRSDAGRNRVPVQSSQRFPRIVAGVITNTGGTPSLTIGGATGGIDFASLTDNGAGDFSVTLTSPFKREPAVFLSTTTQRAQVHTNLGGSTGAIRVLTQAANGTNTDVSGVTNIFVIGSDDASEY